MHRSLASTLALALALAASGCADVELIPTDDAALDAATDAALPPIDAPDARPDLGGPFDAMADAEPDIDPGVCVPAEEICNQRDDDCDTSVDEGAVCCRENAELCNGADDDCDGQIDEGADCCEPGAVEICDESDNDCDGEVDEGDVCCLPETCNDADDDCDGNIDEGNACCDPIDEICDGLDQDCDGTVDEGGVCCSPEICNGVDDDCDDAVDEERVCGLFVQDACRLFIGWADSVRGPTVPSPTWGNCPVQNPYRINRVHCAGTNYDGNFAVIDSDGDVDENDQFAFSLTCRDTGDADLSAWVQSNCALFVGYADNNLAPAGGNTFANCPPQLRGQVGQLACTSTGYDGQFRALRTRGDVDDNDDFSFAWQCREDPARPGLARSIQGQVEVFFGWADRNLGPAHGAAAWGGCPATSRSYATDVRCIGTLGDGAFHKLDLNGDVNEDDEYGVAIRARP